MYYDPTTEATYVFGDPKKAISPATRSTAEKRGRGLVFQANPKVLLVYSKDPAVVAKLKGM